MVCALAGTYTHRRPQQAVYVTCNSRALPAFTSCPIAVTRAYKYSLWFMARRPAAVQLAATPHTIAAALHVSLYGNITVTFHYLRWRLNHSRTNIRENPHSGKPGRFVLVRLTKAVRVLTGIQNNNLCWHFSVYVLVLINYVWRGSICRWSSFRCKPGLPPLTTPSQVAQGASSTLTLVHRTLGLD